MCTPTKITSPNLHDHSLANARYLSPKTREMKDHSTGQYNILWVLSTLSQICSGIRNDEIPLLQVFNAIRKVFTHKQHENQSAPAFKEEFVQNIHAMKAVGATITLPAACLELEANLDPDKTNLPGDNVKQARAFERLMALAYLNSHTVRQLC